MNPSIDQYTNQSIQPFVYLTRGTPVFRDTDLSTEDMQLINEIAPSPLRPEQIYARSMYVCSTQLCTSDGCAFTRNALDSITQKIIGQSVLAGHNRGGLPLARFFKAQVVQKGYDSHGEPIHFVRAWFYWLRETSGAKDLLLNIDGGIYREVSLAWRYNSWTCSICQMENGQCSHHLGQTYDNKPCFKLIDQILDVLEGSLVYKGADKNTCLAGMRSDATGINQEPLVFICDRSDPLFLFLDSIQAIRDTQNLSEANALLQESTNYLWIIERQSATDYSWAASLLTKDGICVIDQQSNQSRNTNLLVTPTVLTPQDRC